MNNVRLGFEGEPSINWQKQSGKRAAKRGRTSFTISDTGKDCKH